MKMQTNRYYISPKVLAKDQKAKYNSQPLSKGEAKAAFSALKLIGIDPVRMIDDAVREAFAEYISLI